MISISNLSMHFGEKTLFEGASFQLNDGNHYGLVGANGSGKSTLLRILAGDIPPENGSVSYPAGIRLGVLKQDHFVYENVAILDVVLMGKQPLWDAMLEKSELSRMVPMTEATGQRIAELELTIADHNGYQAEAEAAELLAGLGISVQQHRQPLNTLSGGYKLRVLLAQCLFTQPDFLLLDEPTNHLDLHSIIWLEEYLNRFPGTCLIISHDQYFLNRVSTHIVDIDYQEIKVYTGNYEQFKKEKALDIAHKEQEIEKQERKKEDLQQFIDRFKAKATKARQANSKVKQLDRMEDIVIKRSSRLSPSFRFDICRPSGKIAFTCDRLSKRFDENTVLNNVTLSVDRGEKLAVIGPNGIGKSTFLKLIAGIFAPSGGSIDLGHEVYTGYCPQDHGDVIPDTSTPYEWLYQFSPGETVSAIMGLLGRVLLGGDDAKKSTAALSGGESARLIFAGIMLQKPNLLLLDEPTNHMDIESLEALGAALQQYPGTIVCVSHDRRFIERFSTAILELKTGGVEWYAGGYAEYLEKQGEDYLDRSMARIRTVKKPTKSGNPSDHSKWKAHNKTVSRLKRTLQKNEERISALEDEIGALERMLSNPDLYKPGNHQELQGLLQRKEELNQQLARSFAAWEEDQARLDEMATQTG